MKTKNIFVLSFAVFAAVMFFSSCGDDSTIQPVSNSLDSCGSGTDKHVEYEGPTFGGYRPSTYTLGSERYYNFFFEVDSICTDTHVNSSFSAIAKDTAGRPIKFTAALEWQLFWERSDTGNIQILSGQRFWGASINDVGLKVPFGENSASVFVNIYVHFPTLGSAALDSAFLARNLTDCTMTFYYHYHKPSADDNIISSENFDKLELFRQNDEKYLLNKSLINFKQPDFK